VSDALPWVTIVIPARPELADIQALAAVRQLDYPPDKIEVLIARGRQPSVQRNAALRAARGELVYFLDDDSLPDPENLRRALAHFEDPKVVVVGGPNLCPPEAPEREQVFALVLGSWLAFGPSRARYTPVGFTRATSEKELILCNLIARRDAILALGGFNEALYPNEENALLDQLQQRGGKLIYDPAFCVQRRPRPTLRAFCRMLFHYGRGRAEQFRVHPTPGSALNFVPPLFVLYGVTLPLTLRWLGLWGLAPLAVYAALLAAQGLDFLARSTPARAARAVPLLVLAHLLYGLGFWRGLFTRLKLRGQPAGAPVTLERVPAQPAAP
jgi:cellulose synthase/poly-beta-1,6-N-acetylglucosamine synthase-like glycosyltransferase